MGLIKPFFLGFVIVSIGCHVGLRTRRRDSGRRPVRRQRGGGGSVAVLATNFFLTRLIITVMY